MHVAIRTLNLVLASAGMLGLTACGSDNDPITQPQPQGVACTVPSPLPAGLPTSAFALTSGNKLISFNPSTGAAIGTAQTITGLASGESIVGIDTRPSDGSLIAVAKNGTSGAIYSISTATGAATALTTTTPLILNGSRYGVDFNPVPGALRIVSDAEENFRLTFPTSTTYAVNTDTALTPAGNIVSAAYTNSFAGSPVTTLYSLDSTSGTLLTQGGVDGASNPNGGGVVSVGSLGVGFNDRAGFDVDGVSGVALATLNVPNTTGSRLYAIDLGNGQATCLGTVAGVSSGEVVTDLAIPTPLAASAVGLTTNNSLVSFTPNAAGIGAISAPVQITGLAANEDVMGIDFRPSTGALTAVAVNTVTGAGAVYEINRTTGQATLIPANSGSPAVTFDTVANSYAVDFNPVPGALRVLTNTGQNFRLTFPSGTSGYTAVVDSAINPTGGASTAAAYTNNFAGTTATRLYVIDTSSNTLKLQEPPNAGTQINVGSLGVTTANGSNGFDIIGGSAISAANSSAIGSNIGNGVALAALNIGGSSTLFRINLQTGAATQIGTTPIGGTAPVLLRGLAINVRKA